MDNSFIKYVMQKVVNSLVKYVRGNLVIYFGIYTRVTTKVLIEFDRQYIAKKLVFAVFDLPLGLIWKGGGLSSFSVNIVQTVHLACVTGWAVRLSRPIFSLFQTHGFGVCVNSHNLWYDFPRFPTLKIWRF